MGSVPFLEQAAVQGYQQGAAQRQALKDQRRNTIAGLYLNAIQTPLPKTDDPEYGKALQKREDLMRQYVAAVGPEQHASFGQHLHGLIFGEPETAQPVHGNAPAAPGAPPATPAPQSDHPFAHNPAYAKIQEGLEGLGKHLKAFAHPLPPQAGPDYAMLASAPTAEERKQAATIADEDRKQKNAVELQRLRNQGRPQTELNRFLDSYAAKIGKPMEDWTPEDFDAANKEFAANRKAPPTPSQAARAVYLRAKYGDHPTAEQIEEGTRAFQQMMSGLKIGEHQEVKFDDFGIPHVLTLTSSSRTDYGAPRSTAAPVVPANFGARPPGTKPTGGAIKAKPISSQAPKLPSWTKGNPLVKAETASYGKAFTDVIAATKLASQADQVAQHPNDAINQKRLAVALERASSGRFTESTLNYIIKAGWGNTIEQWAADPSTGALPPDVMRQLIDGAHENLEAAQDALKTASNALSQLGAPVSSQAPQLPPASHGINWDSLPEAQ